jgi:hypothetical protein
MPTLDLWLFTVTDPLSEFFATSAVSSPIRILTE